MRVLIASLVGATTACFVVPAYECVDAEQCRASAQQGTCEANGYCSYPDDACGPTGRRWGEHAGDALAGQCVAATTPDTATDDAGMDGSADAMGTSGADTSPADCGAWPGGSTRRHALTHPGFGPLDGFPLLVVLDPERIDYAATADDGADLYFVDAGGNELPYDVARWDPQGTSLVWVRVPTVASVAETVWLYHGGPAWHGHDDGRVVWTGYRGAWHLDDGFTDASPTERDLAATGVEFVPGPVGSAARFGPGARASVGSGFADAFSVGGTVSAWVWVDDVDAGLAGTIVGRGSNGDGGFALTVERTAAVGRLAFSRDFSPTVEWSTPDMAIDAGAWHHVVAVLDRSAPVASIYVDGVSAGAMADDPPPYGPAFDDPDDAVLGVGSDADGSGELGGRIDELWITDAVRSSHWIDAEHRSARDELLSWGVEERCGE